VNFGCSDISVVWADTVPYLNCRKPPLKEGVTKKQLEKRAGAISDTAAAMKMREAKRKVFAEIEDAAERGHRP
jgi:hypothetical protein